jgi:hypothetical protein
MCGGGGEEEEKGVISPRIHTETTESTHKVAI